jgi:hypothetical protein
VSRRLASSQFVAEVPIEEYTRVHACIVSTVRRPNEAPDGDIDLTVGIALFINGIDLLVDDGAVAAIMAPA